MVLRKKKTTAKKVIKKTKKSDDSKYFNKTCTTPKGILSYPTLAEPRITNDGKEQYSCDVYVSKEDMLTPAGKKFMKIVNEALDFYDLDEDDCEHFPIVDMDETDDPAEHEVGRYRIRAKNKIAAPTVIDRKKKVMDEDAVKLIKGGDIGMLNVSPFKYVFNGTPGLGLGLEIAVFIDEGEALGGGSSARVSAISSIEIDDIEVDLDDEDEVEYEEDDTSFED